MSLDVECVKKKGNKDDSKCFGLELSVTDIEKAFEGGVNFRVI